FYKFATDQSQMTEFTEMNQAFEWNLLQLQSYFDISIYNVIMFSSDFQYFVTPFPRDIDKSGNTPLTEAYVWSISDTSGQPIDVVSNIIPWWYSATMAFPSWSNNGEVLTFGAFNEEACPTEIYVYAIT